MRAPALHTPIAAHPATASPARRLALVALGCTLTALAFTVVSVRAAQSTSPAHTITVTPDETTQGDLQMVLDSTAALPDNAEVSRSVRRLMGGATAELVLMAKARVDSTGHLQLDDGTLAPVADGDQVDIASSRGGPRVVVVFNLGPNGKVHGRPAFVILNTPGCHRIIDLQQVPPTVLPCS